jgi:hypothetical protein
MAVRILVDTYSGAREEWDTFAVACNASFRCLYRAPSLWKFESQVFSRTKRLSIFQIDGAKRFKIGQCAITLGSRFKVFQDSLQLLPEYRHLWLDTMQEILRHTGQGVYVYGSDWNIDRCHAAEVKEISGVTINRILPIDVIAIDYGNWETWESYYQSVSQNAKRNVKKALKHYDQLNLETKSSWKVFLDICPLERLRSRMFHRKSVRHSLPSLIMRTSLRLMVTSGYSSSQRLLNADKVLAYFLGISLGKAYYFLEAASGDSNHGASAYLLRSMIEGTFLASGGKGIFVFGPDDHRLAGDPVWEGLVRSRQQWRAEPFPTSMLKFTYSGPAL